MQTNTGIIEHFASDEERKKAGFDLPLTNSEYEHVKPMNRAQRRAWAKQQKRSK